MSNKLEVAVIGLGKFGMALARTLTEMGHDVVGVDHLPDHVRRAQGELAQVYEADGTSREALEQLGFKDFERVVVSTGESMEASILVCMNLQELGVSQIWVKAISLDHEKVLRRLGVHLVVFPEQHVARQLAHRVAIPGLLDYLDLGDDVLTREIVVEDWAGKTLVDLRLPAEYGVQVVAVRHVGDDCFSFVPRADAPLQKGDVLVIIGHAKDVMRLKG